MTRVIPLTTTISHAGGYEQIILDICFFRFMNGHLRRKLRELVAEQGSSLAKNPQQTEELLQELFGGYPREVRLLVGALYKGIPLTLLEAPKPITGELLHQLTQRLQNAYGLPGFEARWAVETWALAFNLISEADCQTGDWSGQYIDLVCIVDCIGNPELIEERCDFVRAFVKVLERRLGPFNRLQVSLLAYTDHNHLRSQVYKSGSQALHWSDLGSPEEMLRALRQVRAEPGQDFEAALEDALAALNGLDWHPESHRFAVTIGSRPPHPLRPQAGLRQVGSPSGQDWAWLLEYAQNRLKLHSISILCPIFWPSMNLPSHAEEYAAYCWREIGYTARFRFQRTTPEEVAESVMKVVSTAII